jgi:phosphoribosylformylglycinamidine synthase
VTGYAYVPDFDKVLTPDIKRPGRSQLLLIDHGLGKDRLGGSAFLQTLNQLGDKCPDIDDADMFIRAQKAILSLHDDGMLLSYHDRSDGGSICAVLEMLMSGNCGASINLAGQDVWKACFAEEAGQIIEVADENASKVMGILRKWRIDFLPIGSTQNEKILELSVNGERVAEISVTSAREVWSETAFQIDRLQIDPACAGSEWKNLRLRHAPDLYWKGGKIQVVDR